MWFSFDTGNKNAVKNKRDLKSGLEIWRKIEKAVNGRIDSVFEGASSTLVKFLKDHLSNDDVENDDLCVALVCCSFSHVQILTRSLQKALPVKLFIITKETNIRHTIEEARQSDGIFLIEQIESLANDNVEKLFYLMQWFELRHPFIICASTGSNSFSNICSLSTLRKLYSDIFTMPDPYNIYNILINDLIEQSRTEHVYLSGDALISLRSHYFTNSFSIQELMNAAKLFIQHNNWIRKDNSEVEMVEFDHCVENYWHNLKFVAEKMAFDLYDLHFQIQTTKNFSFLENIHSAEDLLKEWVEQVFVNEQARQKMRIALIEFENASKVLEQKQKFEPKEILNNKTELKMSSVQLRRQLESKRNAKLLESIYNPENLLKADLLDIIHNLVPCWDTFKGSQIYLVGSEPKNALYGNSAILVENAILKENYKLEHLAIAFNTLHQRSNWRTIQITDWFTLFSNASSELSEDNSISAFFAVLSQLESMGIIKCSNEKVKDNISIIHYPTTLVL